MVFDACLAIYAAMMRGAYWLLPPRKRTDKGV